MKYMNTTDYNWSVIIAKNSSNDNVLNCRTIFQNKIEFDCYELHNKGPAEVVQSELILVDFKNKVVVNKTMYFFTEKQVA